MSEQSKVTGGEWRLVNADHAEEIDIYSGGRYIASIPVSGTEHIAEEDRANAHLLAASKDMKEAGQKLMQLVDDPKVQLMLAGGNDVDSKGWKLTEALHELRQALAKADGGVE